MPGVTKQTLAFAIFSMAFDRCRLTDQLNNNAAAAEDAEELGDTILNMGRSLAELRRLYAAYQDEIGEYDSYEVLCDNAEKDYVEFSRQIIQRASRRAG